MKYVGMPMGMWMLFGGSFRAQLCMVFGYDAAAARAIAAKAKPKYREIIGKLPEFEKGDRYRMNAVNCALLGAFVLAMPERPDVERLTDYYAKAMMTGPCAGSAAGAAAGRSRRRRSGSCAPRSGSGPRTAIPTPGT